MRAPGVIPLPLQLYKELRRWERAGERLAEYMDLTPGVLPARVGVKDIRTFGATISSCEADWAIDGYAAPLWDPNPTCDTESDLGWWLSTTSIALLRTSNSTSRMFFHNGQLRDGASLPGRMPINAYTQAGSSLQKFGWFDENGTWLFATDPDDIAEYWRMHLNTSQTPTVEDLHFSADFISFLDSDASGRLFPIYAPFVLNSNDADPCIFSLGVSSLWTWGSQRAGWRSTVIPCRGARLVYQCDSVLEIPLNNGASGFLMFAVECDGRAQGASGEDVVEAETDPDNDQAPNYPQCVLCSPADPATNCRASTIPLTRYVFFLCDNADFQVGVRGPYDVFPVAPSQANNQWVGVPHTFVDPSGRFLFFYVHPTEGTTTPYPYAGMNIARMGDIVEVLTRIMTSQPGNFTAAGALIDGALHFQQDLREDYSAVFHQHIRNVGEIYIAGLDNPNYSPEARVDEHFVFCDDRLHLFTTRKTAGGAAPILDEIVHAYADLAFDPDQVDIWLDEPFAPHVLEMFTAFTLDEYPTLDISDATGSASSEVNDPCAWQPVGDGQDPSEDWAMLFYSGSHDGLMVASSCPPCFAIAASMGARDATLYALRNTPTDELAPFGGPFTSEEAWQEAQMDALVRRAGVGARRPELLFW